MGSRTLEDGAPSRWTILAVLFAARVGLGFQFQTLGSVSDVLAVDLQLSFAEVGTLIGLFMLPGLILALPAGLLGPRMSDRSLVTFGLIALALGGSVASIANGFSLLAIGRFLCGVGFLFSTIYFTKMVADWFAGRELATAMGVLVMSWPFGIAMGQIVHGWLAADHAWRAAFVAASLYCLAAAALVYCTYRSPPGERGPAAKTVPSSFTRREWGLVLAASGVWAAFNAAYIVYLSFAPKVLTAGGFGALQAAAVISIASWVMIFSGALCGYVADRSGRPDRVLYACLAVGALSLLLLPHVDYAVGLSLAFGLMGMAPAGVIMALTAEAVAPERRALGMGIFFSGYFLITAPAPAIAGWLFDRGGDPYQPILFAVVLFALTAISNLLFRAIQRSGSRPGT
jgi:predicted MFS family arabinose efflux permease